MTTSSQWLLSKEEYDGLHRKEITSKRPWTMEHEELMRYHLIGLCQRLGVALRMPQAAIATAHVYLHRFLIRESSLDMQSSTIPSIVFLTAKVEEQLRRIKDVLSAWETVRVEALKKWQAVAMESDDHAAGSNSIERLFRGNLVDMLSVVVDEPSLLRSERCVLRVLCFDLEAKHPYACVFSIVKQLFSKELGGLADLSDDLVQSTWTIVNDSYRTTLCIRFESLVIAVAAVSLALLRMQTQRNADDDDDLLQERVKLVRSELDRLVVNAKMDPMQISEAQAVLDLLYHR